MQCRLVRTTWSMSSVMSGLNAGNANGFCNDANVAPLDAICKTNNATSCESHRRNLRLMPGVGVGTDVHGCVSRKSVIRIGNSVVGTSQPVQGVLVLTLLQHLSHGRIVRRRLFPGLL